MLFQETTLPSGTNTQKFRVLNNPQQKTFTIVENWEISWKVPKEKEPVSKNNTQLFTDAADMSYIYVCMLQLYAHVHGCKQSKEAENFTCEAQLTVVDWAQSPPMVSQQRLSLFLSLSLFQAMKIYGVGGRKTSEAAGQYEPMNQTALYTENFPRGPRPFHVADKGATCWHLCGQDVLTWNFLASTSLDSMVGCTRK